MIDPANLPDEVRGFLTERHLASLTLIDASGDPHVSAVGFTWDDDQQVARVITFSEAKKSRLLVEHAPMRAVLCQIDGGRWLALHGTATVSADPVVNADAEARYGERYRPAGDRGADRRTIEVHVDRLVGRA